MPVQVPLPFVFHGNQNFDSYFAGPNRQVVEALRTLVDQDHGERFLFIRGDSGLGKSHLLQAACRAASELHQSAFYLPFKELPAFSPGILEELENYTLVCVDDLDSIAGIPDWELAFFHFFNRHREKSNKLIVSASLSPKRLPIRLPDLASRLQWGLSLKLEGMSDRDKLAALMLKARQLGFRLPQEVGLFLLSRYSRDLPSLWRSLETLDYASLSEQRRLTIPFLKSHLPKN